MTLTQRRCAHCGCKNVQGYRMDTIKDGEQRTMYHCSSCDRAFSETRPPPKQVEMVAFSRVLRPMELAASLSTRPGSYTKRNQCTVNDQNMADHYDIITMISVGSPLWACSKSVLMSAAYPRAIVPHQALRTHCAAGLS